MLGWLKTKARRLWIRLTAFSAATDLPSHEQTRLKYYTIFVLLGLPAALVYGAVNLMHGNWVLALGIFGFFLCLMLGWLSIRRARYVLAIYRINMMVFVLLLWSLVAIGGSRLLWVYAFPLIAFFLFGRREGFWWCALLYVVALVIVGAGPVVGAYAYGPGYLSRFATTFAIVSAIAFGFEYLRYQFETGMAAEQRKLVAEQSALRREIEERIRTEREKEQLIEQLQAAIDEVKTLQKLIPICSHCHKIRDDAGSWQRLEKYFEHRLDARFSHGVCQDCVQELYPFMTEKQEGKDG